MSKQIEVILDKEDEVQICENVFELIQLKCFPRFADTLERFGEVQIMDYEDLILFEESNIELVKQAYIYNKQLKTYVFPMTSLKGKVLFWKKLSNNRIFGEEVILEAGNPCRFYLPRDTKDNSKLLNTLFNKVSKYIRHTSPLIRDDHLPIYIGKSLAFKIKSGYKVLAPNGKEINFLNNLNFKGK